MTRGKNSNQKKTREEVNREGSSWAVWVKQILMLTGRKTQVERKLLIQQPQSPLNCANMLNLSVTTGVSSLMEKPWRRVWIPCQVLHKRTSVIATLAKQAVLKLECHIEKRTRWNPSKEVERDVENFYLHPDISYTMPGKGIFPSGFQ